MSMRDAKGDPKKIRPPKPKPANPIAVAIKQWLATLRSASAAALEGLDTESLLSSAPKRFTIYEPMVLLPSGSFDSPAWQALLSHPALDPAHVDDLWHALLQELSKKQKAPLTHLAANQGIPPLVESDSSGDPSSDNILRSPSGLRMLYGDFGPATSPSGLPSHDDFARAFWVSTRQNGIWQTWAPRWTMFSRGNVKEKARLLAFHADAATATFPHRAAVPLPSDTGSTAAAPWAVDMYAGIGYFTFSYARLGMRVLCWELNPWSVEALRRGVVANGWRDVHVVRGRDLLRPTRELVPAGARIVVFLEDNGEAARRVAAWRSRDALDVLHINCGLLPTSEATWRPCWEIVARGAAPASWLHLHDNVATGDIDARRADIQSRFDGWARGEGDEGEGVTGREARVEHVELVKTYAPDVWHCVFDVCILKVHD
ncbi:hypothetical protein VDGD_02033 [Verticillium dahliae]|nr:hypothetical protein VDGD_02033 [Verticillium dahliae]